jgi:hypothetical protein
VGNRLSIAAWWCIPVIAALSRLRKENFEFKTSEGDPV